MQTDDPKYHALVGWVVDGESRTDDLKVIAEEAEQQHKPKDLGLRCEGVRERKDLYKRMRYRYIVFAAVVVVHGEEGERGLL